MEGQKPGDFSISMRMARTGGVGFGPAVSPRHGRTYSVVQTLTLKVRNRPAQKYKVSTAEHRHIRFECVWQEHLDQ